MKKLFRFIKSLFLRRRPVETVQTEAAIPVRRSDVRCLSKTGVHRMSYVEWGNPANPRVLVCAHGLTRNARDFDALAQALSSDYRVICPDIVGHGHSDWLADPLGYAVPQYVSDVFILLRKLHIKEVDWVGTSMGGLIGMGLASHAQSPIRKLVLNDVGPVISAASLRLIAEHVGHAPVFSSLEAATDFIRTMSTDFSPLTNVQWQHLTAHSIKQDGSNWVMRYDPGLGDLSRSGPILTDIAIWPYYDAIHCPTLLIRGEKSDMLSAETAQEMTQRGPHAKLVDIAGIGHAPRLMDEAQITLVKDFLLHA